MCWLQCLHVSFPNGLQEGHRNGREADYPLVPIGSLPCSLSCGLLERVLDSPRPPGQDDGLYCKVTVLPTVMRCPNHQLQSALVSALHPYKALALAC